MPLLAEKIIAKSAYSQLTYSKTAMKGKIIAALVNSYDSRRESLQPLVSIT